MSCRYNKPCRLQSVVRTCGMFSIQKEVLGEEDFFLGLTGREVVVVCIRLRITMYVRMQEVCGACHGEDGVTASRRHGVSVENRWLGEGKNSCLLQWFTTYSVLL